MDNLLEYENLVYSIINRYSKYFDKEDLYQVGMMGLSKAYKNFDSEANTKFSTYAFLYIKGEVLKYVRENKTIKVSKDIVRLNSSIERTRDIMRQRLGREPTMTELSLFLEVDEDKITEASLAVQDVKSLNYAYDEDSCEFYNSIKVTEKGMDADVLDLRAEIEKLAPEEKNIIVARYYGDLTQTETSRELGISQVQVSRKESKILQKLKSGLENGVAC